MEMLNVGPGQTALFGYGSLISRSSLVQTLGCDYDGPFIACGLRGWERSWDIAMPNEVSVIRFRFVSSGGAGVVVNGILFLVDAVGLQAFDRREWIYDRVDITDDLENTALSGRLFAYVGKPEYVRTNVCSPRDAAVRQSYVAILESGLAAMDSAFRREYQTSTEPLPRHLVIADQR